VKKPGGGEIVLNARNWFKDRQNSLFSGNLVVGKRRKKQVLLSFIVPDSYDAKRSERFGRAKRKLLLKYLLGPKGGRKREQQQRREKKRGSPEERKSTEGGKSYSLGVPNAKPGNTLLDRETKDKKGGGKSGNGGRESNETPQHSLRSNGSK